MRKKVLLLVTIVLIITRSLTYASTENLCSNEINGECDHKNSSDLEDNVTPALTETLRISKSNETTSAVKTKVSPALTETKSSTESLITSESSKSKNTRISDDSKLITMTFTNEMSLESSIFSESENTSGKISDSTDLNYKETESDISSSTDFTTTIDFTLKDNLETSTEDVTDTSLQETEIVSTEDITTVQSTESTIQETTTEEILPEECEFNSTSYEIGESNMLTINWKLNNSTSCNSLNVSIVLINQSCIDKCKDEICSCDEEEQIEVADHLNFRFSKNLTPCIKYSYKIQIINSSEKSISKNITTEFSKYLKPAEPKLINSTDTSLTLKVILNDAEIECQDIKYFITCQANQSGPISRNSSADIILIDELESKQNYSCSARIRHGQTEWSEYSEASIFTTKVTDCNLTIAYSEINNETNAFTLIWETNNSEMCATAYATISLTNKNCVDKCEKDDCFCSQSLERKANDLKYIFLEPLIPCATYTYQIQIVNSTTSSDIFSSTFDAYRKYGEIENFTITDEEEIKNNSNTLNMVITWEYKNVECLETFIVSARGQGNNYESSIQGYRHKFLNLEACEEFNINIHIKDHQEINASAIHMMKRVIPSEIRNLSLSQEDDKSSILIAWTAPEYGAKCIYRYIIRVKNDSENEFTRNTSSNVYLLSGVYACVNYSITIGISTSANDNENLVTTTTAISSPTTIRTTTLSPSISPADEDIIESSISGSIKTEPKQFNQPQNLQLNKQTDKSLSFNVIPSNDPENKCSIYGCHVECMSTENANITKTASSSSNLVEVEGLEPFHNYSCKAAIENEKGIKSIWSYISFFMTKEGVPNAPNVDIAQGTVTSTSFTIKWKEPTSPKGIIKQYHVYIKFVKFEYENPSYCSEVVTGENKTLLVETLDPSYLSYTFKNAKPNSAYTIQIRASNQAFDGDFSSSKGQTTKAGPPDELQNFTVHKNEIKLNEAYNKTIYIDFSYPCRANGKLQEFVIEFKSIKNTFNKTISYNNSINEEYEYRLKIDELEPDTYYTINGYAYGEGDIKGKDTIIRDFKLNAGIPEERHDIHITKSESTTSSIHITLSDNLFVSNVGQITQARIFILQWNCTDMTHKSGFINDDEHVNNIFYFDAMNKSRHCIPEYDTGIIIENNKDEKQQISIGTGPICEEETVCNGKLRPGTTYGVTYRLYTETGYSTTEYFKISTNKEVPIVAISIIILSILCLVFLIGFYISCRRTQDLRKSALDSPYDRKDISVQNFQLYHNTMSKSDNEKIKEEYKAIQYFSDTLDRTYIASRANEKLNRYINIYPYDSTRVVLNDDEFENDYINASYINGYYYPKEYIAAQGPKPDTVLDFWRMVLQHRTESIVMLTSLVENNKVKCHEYFPKLNGRLTSGNITVTCMKEQNFPSYIKRVLTVEKNDMKLNVNHYYFCKWPDHGCPNNASDLIDFVKIIRNERQKPSETFIVHCSAGVGRTGTFIAVDIMIQRIKKEAKINIFDLVKQLRSQRMKMVQSCDQYVFLYTAALELISMSRRANVFQNFRDTILKFVNELEIPESWKRRNNPPNELTDIVKLDEKETVM